MSATGQGFSACLFDPKFGNEMVEGRIVVDRFAIRFQSDSCSHQIPVDDVELEIEENGDRIYFRDPNQPDLTLFTTDASILNHPAFRQVNALRAQVGEISGRRELRRAVRLTAYFAIGCLLVFWLGSLAMDLAVRWAAARVPEQWEQPFGDQQIEALQEKHELLDDSNAVAQLSVLAKPLLGVVPAATNGVHFYIQDSLDPNAFALPGGHVVVTLGMLRLVDTPDELLGVLAHELAHVSQRHMVRALLKSAGPIMIFGVLFHSRNGLVNLLSTGSGVMVLQGYSQEFESEADEIGWKYLVAADIDPRGMIQIFQKLKAFEEKEKLGPGLPQAFESHPALEKRIARLQELWNKLPQKSGYLLLTNSIPKPESGKEQEHSLPLLQ